jgi:hypothetical protein
MYSIITFSKFNFGFNQVYKWVTNYCCIIYELNSHTFIHSTALFVCLMMFNATFNNISVISWRSVLLVEEVARHWQTLSHKLIMLYTSPWSIFELTTSVVIGTDCIGNCKSNYHMITWRRPQSYLNCLSPHPTPYTTETRTRCIQ